MAVIAAARIFTPKYAQWQEFVRGIYTFGQPFVGDAQFACECKKRGSRTSGCIAMSTRTTSFHPHQRWIPAPTSISGTSGSLHRRRKDGAECARPTNIPSPFILRELIATAASFFTRRLGFLNGFEPGFSLDDHSPQKYVDTSRFTLSIA